MRSCKQLPDIQKVIDVTVTLATVLKACSPHFFKSESGPERVCILSKEMGLCLKLTALLRIDCSKYDLAITVNKIFGQ